MYKDWPSISVYTKNFLKQAMYVENKNSPICKKCLEELWGCAREDCSLLKEELLYCELPD